RSVMRAICTSGDPVSESLRRNCCMISVFRSFVLAIAPSLPPSNLRLLPLVSEKYRYFRLRSSLWPAAAESRGGGQKSGPRVVGMRYAPRKANWGGFGPAKRGTRAAHPAFADTRGALLRHPLRGFKAAPAAPH